jgi:hypothetical protein
MIRMTEDVARMGELRNALRANFSLGSLESTASLGRLTRDRQEDNIKMGLKEIELEGNFSLIIRICGILLWVR